MSINLNESVDIFKFFDRMADGDFDFVDRLTDEEIKSMSPYVMLMWEGQTDTEIRNIITNEFCNGMVFSLSKHPRLLVKLFIAAGAGMGRTRYQFVKSISKQETAVFELIARHYQCGYEEAKELRRLLSDKDIKELKEIYEHD